MKKILLATFFILLSPVTFGETINIECTFKSSLSNAALERIKQNPSSRGAKFIRDFATQEKKWWEFWVTDSKLLFSIDVKNKSATVTSDLSTDTIPYVLISTHTVEILPDRINITGLDGDSSNHSTYDATRYSIDRINGYIIGTSTAPNKNATYYNLLKVGDDAFSLFGKCKPISRLF